MKETVSVKLKREFPGCRLEMIDWVDGHSPYEMLQIPDGTWFFGLFTNWKTIAVLELGQKWWSKDRDVAMRIERLLNVEVTIYD